MLVNLCLSRLKKTQHISFTCQFYSVWRTIKMREAKLRRNGIVIIYITICIQNNPHKMRYSHEMNDEWFIAFHFDSFPYFRFHFYTMLWQLVSIRFICHTPHSILQLNYVIVIAFALQLPLVYWNMALDILLSIYIFSHIFQMARI